MSKDKPNYKQFLNEHGIKSTKQRNLLLTILHETGSLLTAEALYFKAKKADDTISLSTIYRVVSDLEKVGLITQNLHGRDEAKYALPY